MLELPLPVPQQHVQDVVLVHAVVCSVGRDTVQPTELADPLNRGPPPHMSCIGS